MKKLMLVMAALAACATVALAGLDTSGFVYTTVADNTKAGGTATTNGWSSWVDVSALKGNGYLWVTDTSVTPTAGAYGLDLFTGSTTSTISTAVSVTLSSATNSSTVTGGAVNTEALSKYIRLRWTAMETTTVHYVNGVLVTHN